MVSSEFTSGIFKYKGDPLYYERRGTGERFVLLIPGALGTGTLHFSKQHDGFDLTKFSLISVDPIGYGNSRPAKRPLIKHYWVDAEAYHQLMTVELAVKQYVILGFSDGGRVGLIMGAEYPDHIKKIVACGSSCYVTENEKQVLNSTRIVSNWNVTARSNLEAVYGPDLQSLWNEFLDIYTNLNDIFKGDLVRITCPVFILHGESDPIVVVEHAYYYKTHLVNSELYVHPKGGHYFHTIDNALFNTKVTKFFLKE